MSATEAHEHAPFIDYENIPAPTEGILVTHFITVRSIARSRAFYSEVLGGQVVLEDNPCIVKLANSGAPVGSGALLVHVASGEGRLRRLATKHVVLTRRELLPDQLACTSAEALSLIASSSDW